ncbi:hypothetical protein ACHAXR_013265 [Thalassiosira sp. AJA248-18]
MAKVSDDAPSVIVEENDYDMMEGDLSLKADEEPTASAATIDDDAPATNEQEDDEVAALIDEDQPSPPTHRKDDVMKQQSPKSAKKKEHSKEFEIADIVEMYQARSQATSRDQSIRSGYTAESDLDRANSRSQYSTVARTAKLANDAKNDNIDRRLQESQHSSSSTNGNNDSEANKSSSTSPSTSKNNNEQKTPSKKKIAYSVSLDADVANVDKLLTRISYAVILIWISLLGFSYWIVPPGSIQWYEGTERNAALVELSILATAVIMKHFPLLWEMNLLGDDGGGRGGGGGRRNSGSSSSSSSNMMKFGGGDGAGRAQLSGILKGGMVTQFIAVMTAVIMVCFPVPVMIDPILGSRVHFIRWCEWVPLAGYMTLMTECIDAPHYDGTKLTHHWKAKFTVAGMEFVSTACALTFPFCTNLYVWCSAMAFSCATYSAIIFRYFEKVRLFQSCVWRGGGSVDEMELYERARMSLALHGVCCVVWTLITLNYFVTSAGHLVVPECWTIVHDPAATMIGECFMDLIAKCLYMSLIIEAHHTAFDEAKRANRRLAELRNTMSVVWENSSDTIAISVQKMSGNITSMVSPSFFRPALIARQQCEKMEDISAIVLEHSGLAVKSKRGSITNLSKINADELPDVKIKILKKADFGSVDLHSAGKTDSFECLGRTNDAMTSLVVAFTDMLARAWHSESDEVLFEHDTVTEDGGVRTKYEVKVTKLEENAVVVVVRNVSERYRRFEAEKRFVFETTARQKDAEANRFTRHEVKNGLLAAIEICGNVREQLSDDFSLLRQDYGYTNDTSVSEDCVSGRMENMAELDRTLHEVLDIVLAETMARDVIHEMYVPRRECIDVNHILTQTRGFKATDSQISLVCNPSPLPILLSDQGLFKCIHGNAIRNALKYGERGGKITTEATYDSETGEFILKVTNLPGPGHEKIVAMGSRASELVFAHGTRLHKDSDLGKRSHSAGDGAWIIRKCAKILGGTVGINFEHDRTVFEFRAPVKTHSTPTRDVETFHIPHGVWGIGIDDSKIQRKLLRRFFHHAGVQEPRQIILGQKPEEIAGFVDFVVDFVNAHPGEIIFLIADENLEMDNDSANHETISGSECIKQIRNSLDREQEMNMLALVRSANDSPRDLALYTSRAHGYMPKVPLRGLSVRETVSSLWKERFPPEIGGNQEDENEDTMSRIASIENLRDLTLISPVELLAELEQVDSLCVRIRDSTSRDDRWPVLWEKLHQLKGDLKSVNVDNKFSTTINLIEALRGENHPTDFMTTWLRIRSDVVSFLTQST